MPARTVRLVLGAAAAVGLASMLPALAGITAPSAIGLRCLVAGVAYLAAAAAILARRRPLARVGSTFAGLALVLYAADQLAYFALSFGARGSQLSRVPLLMTFDLLGTAVLGLALVAWLLEGEREKQVHAAELARRRERAQACAYRISEAARTVWDLPALFRSIHESLGDVLPARNFYIALHDRASGLVSFPYFSDERDTTPAPKPLGRGLTEYVLRTGQPLLATPEVFRSLVARGEVELIASDSVDWLGAPLVARGEVIGVAAVQTYDRAVRLGPEERDLFVFVSGQIAAAVEAKRAEDALRQSETRLRVAIQQVPAVLWTTDEELRFTSSLGAGLSALGLAPNQVVGMSLEQYLGAGNVGLDRHRLALRRRVGRLRVRARGPRLHRARRAPARRGGRHPGHGGNRSRHHRRASGRPGPARVGSPAPPGDRPRAALHLREGRGGPLPPREPGRGRGLRHDGGRAQGPHRRRLRPVGGGGAALPGRRPRGDPQRPAPGRPRGADHRHPGPGAAPADHEDPVHVLRHRPARGARRLDRHLREEGGGGGAAARGEGGVASAFSPAAWPTTSTTSSPRSSATPRWP